MSQFAPESINLVPLTSELCGNIFPRISGEKFWCSLRLDRSVLRQMTATVTSHPSPSPSSGLKPQIVEISQNLLLMLLPNAFSLPAGQKSTSEIPLLFWRRGDEDARSQTISPVTSSRPGRHGRPRDHEWCREKAMKASFSQDSQRRLAADG